MRIVKLNNELAFKLEVGYVVLINFHKNIGFFDVELRLYPIQNDIDSSQCIKVYYIDTVDTEVSQNPHRAISEKIDAMSDSEVIEFVGKIIRDNKIEA